MTGTHPDSLTGADVFDVPDASLSPTDPAELVAWLRALPVGTILRDNLGAAWHLDALDPRVDTILTLQRADRSIPLKASHLRLVLAALDEEPPSPPDTGKLCCCGTGTDCPACLTGRCWECPDNPERERDDEPDDWQDDDD